MSYGTIQLPVEIINAAERYAKREHRTVVDLFADLMGRHYGFVRSIQSAQPLEEVSGRRQVEIPESVKAISGIISLPKGKSESDIIHDALLNGCNRHTQRATF